MEDQTILDIVTKLKYLDKCLYCVQLQHNLWTTTAKSFSCHELILTSHNATGMIPWKGPSRWAMHALLGPKFHKLNMFFLPKHSLIYY